MPMTKSYLERLGFRANDLGILIAEGCRVSFDPSCGGHVYITLPNGNSISIEVTPDKIDGAIGDLDWDDPLINKVH